MTYIFSFVAGRYKTIMWTALSLRWVFHVMVGHWPASIVLAVSMGLGLPLKFDLGLTLLVAVILFFGFGKRRDFVRIIAFRRRWPHTWATVQKKQLTDMDDGHYNRPWLTAPKLSWRYSRVNQAIIFKVKPAVGSNLSVLQDQVSDLAAQYKNIDSIEVSYIKPSDYRGELKLLLKDTMAETKQSPDQRIRHAANA